MLRFIIDLFLISQRSIKITSFIAKDVIFKLMKY